ncbi:ferrous iron transporter B [Corynebacterium sp. CCUG 69979]|nr:ferrous iron transporter B [Corynebacterium pseudogenitalium]MCQ4622503.1 ferrous iron transporter B [Corynebacterium sp. CCUG 70398]MCQ4624014.1 ferrous iron transporter B [Corynebacterium sp. CCUG 69979]
MAAPLQSLLEDFVLGPCSDWARAGLAAVGLNYPFVEGLLVDGIINGVGMVLTFVPLMALMFLCLAVLEDSGYMARAAVVADRLMRAIGLPGKAFIPLIVGFGCNVPAISATRVLATPEQRRLTALLVPFTSCSARLTVYVMLAQTFFPDKAGLVVFAMYVISIALVVLSGLLLRTTLWRTMGSDPLVIDLPVYQWPTARLSFSVMWSRLKGFLQTAGGIIVATVVVIWFLLSTPAAPGHSWGDEDLAPQDSLYGVVADSMAPVFEPAGFDSWSLTGPLVTGFLAKEALIATWAQTYDLEDVTDAAPEEQGASPLAQAVRADFEETSGGNTLAAVWAYMIFLLAYTPCVATLAAQRREIGWKWTAIGLVGQLALAWLLAVATFQGLSLVL